MKIFRSTICVAAICAALSIFPAGAFSEDKKPYSPFEIDALDKSRAPDFTLKDLKGKEVSLSSYRGKVVLLNFWATWCPACTSELPSLSALYRDLKNRGFEVVLVSTDASAASVRDFVDKKKLGLTVLIDENRDTSRKYKVFSLPTTFLLDKNGVITEKYFGDYDWTEPEIRQTIEKLL